MYDKAIMNDYNIRLGGQQILVYRINCARD